MATDSAKTVKGVPLALITSKMASTNETTKLSFLTPSVCSVCSSQNNKIERFSTGCRKTKSKAISLANQTSHQQQRTSQNACNRRLVMENAPNKDAIGFTSDSSRKWREIFQPIREQGKAKPKQTQITFNTQLKTALFQQGFCLSSLGCEINANPFKSPEDTVLSQQDNNTQRGRQDTCYSI